MDLCLCVRNSSNQLIIFGVWAKKKVASPALFTLFLVYNYDQMVYPRISDGQDSQKKVVGNQTFIIVILQTCHLKIIECLTEKKSLL